MKQRVSSSLGIENASLNVTGTGIPLSLFSMSISSVHMKMGKRNSRNLSEKERYSEVLLNVVQFITFAGKFLSKISPSIDCHCRNLEAHVASENSHDGEEPLMLYPAPSVNATKM